MASKVKFVYKKASTSEIKTLVKQVEPAMVSLAKK